MKTPIYIYKFVNMNEMAFQDLLVLTFENYSKMYDCFDPPCIEQFFFKPS